MASIYRQKVMNHFTAPRNKGSLKEFDENFLGENISCGDEVSFWVKLDDDHKVKEVGWQGSGCTISQAAASILSELMVGRSLEEIKKMDNNKLLKELEMELSPTRRKCALLPLYTIKEEELD